MSPTPREAETVKTHLFSKFLKVMVCQRVMFTILDLKPACHQFHDYTRTIYSDSYLYHFLMPENLWPSVFQKKPLYLLMLR